jgi:carboxymethylenebutenolidase
MGEMTNFPCGDASTDGYLAVPASGSGPGVMVIQEWWGLVPQIKGVCDRVAEAGFTALAPDLFHGEYAGHTEMDKAGELMNSLPPERAARDMAGAVDCLLQHPAVSSARVGVVGFCMGGMLALVLGAREGDRLGAVVSYYGAPLGDSAPDWSGLTAAVLGHVAGADAFFPPDAVTALFDSLRAMGKDVTYYVYPGTGHAFANEENALGTHDAEATDLAWQRTIDFLRDQLH